MDTNRKEARKLLDGESMDQFIETMRCAKLTDVQKQVCEYRYVKGYSFTKIACTTSLEAEKECNARNAHG